MSKELDENAVTMGGEAVTLAQLAGIDLDGIQEKRFSDFPAGNFFWEVVADPEPPKLVAINGKAAVPFNLKCLQVFAVKDVPGEPPIKPEDWVGKVHRETMFLSDLESIGYLKAFLIDIGGTGKGALDSLLLGTVGLRFAAPIAKRRDKDDHDKIYTNINRMKLIPEAKMAKVAA